jgi:hydrogenase nickel incorporation protein HypA/HybF
MHELALTQEIIALICERMQGARVTRVVLEIGRLSAVLPDAIRFCFDVCAEGTSLDGATLDVIEVPGSARCRVCGEIVVLQRPFGICRCGCTDLEWISGDELKIKEVEVA